MSATTASRATALTARSDRAARHDPAVRLLNDVTARANRRRPMARCAATSAASATAPRAQVRIDRAVTTGRAARIGRAATTDRAMTIGRDAKIDRTATSGRAALRIPTVWPLEP